MTDKNRKGGPGKAPPKSETNLDDTRLAYSMREVADLLGVSEKTVYLWIKAGKLRSSKPDRIVLIPRSSVLELLGEVAP